MGGHDVTCTLLIIGSLASYRMALALTQGGIRGSLQARIFVALGGCWREY